MPRKTFYHICLEIKALLCSYNPDGMSFLNAVGICEAMWVLCAWPTVYSSHTPRMYAVKVLFRHTSRGWILLVQPPRISTCDMLFSSRLARTSSLRWTSSMSNTNKASRPLVCLTRSFTVQWNALCQLVFQVFTVWRRTARSGFVLPLSFQALLSIDELPVKPFPSLDGRARSVKMTCSLSY